MRSSSLDVMIALSELALWRRGMSSTGEGDLFSVTNLVFLNMDASRSGIPLPRMSGRETVTGSGREDWWSEGNMTLRCAVDALSLSLGEDVVS
eukprot:14716867-Ditylum_brightwellii.AAC.2